MARTYDSRLDAYAQGARRGGAELGEVARVPVRARTDVEAIQREWLSGQQSEWAGRQDPNALPYNDQIDSTMAGLRALVDEWQGAMAPQRWRNAAINSANQQSALRGLRGPLAASVASGADQGVLANFEDMRRGALAQLLMQQGGFASQQQQLEYLRRQYQQQLNQQARAARSQNEASIWQLGGGVLGGAAGAYFGGPQGAAAGYQLGTGIGGGLYGLYGLVNGGGYP